MEAKRIEKMLEMQDSMNLLVHRDWRDQNWPWHRAIRVEAMEMLEHYGWKWWKKQDADISQVKMELVDIWQFGLSQVLQQNEGIRLDVIASNMVDEADDVEGVEPPDPETFRLYTEQFIFSTLGEDSFRLVSFLTIAKCLHMSFYELYTLYMGKNVLNRFRQANGYKEGTYIKVWGGDEDNVHLVRILNKVDKTVLDIEPIIYKQLHTLYGELCL